MTPHINNEMDKEDIISPGKYIIVCKQKYNKLFLLGEQSHIYLGKDKVQLNEIIGQRFWSTFKMIQGESKKNYTLKFCDKNEIIAAEEYIKNKTSGADNRDIFDDGSSQLLSTEEIVGLRDSGLSSQAIVNQLVENSKTFHNKTEYSQQKYLKKKGKKYFEYIMIKKPTIRILSELFSARDPMKVLGLRYDTLSQIITSVNLQPGGKYILYENGSQGIVAATILNYLSDGGKLIQITPHKFAQKHAILAMNYNKNQLDRMKCIKLSELFKNKLNNQSNFEKDVTDNKHTNDNIFNSDKLSDIDDKDNEIKIKNEIADKMSGSKEQSEHLHEKNDCNNDHTINDETKEKNKEMQNNVNNFQKRKSMSTNENSENDVITKRPRWELEAQEAIDLLNTKNNDGLIIICKEYPLNLFSKLIPFIALSRSFVIFHYHREVLTQLYIELKRNYNTANVKLTDSWLRTYQILPERTHPDILMSGSGGYILSGIIVSGA